MMPFGISREITVMRDAKDSSPLFMYPVIYGVLGRMHMDLVEHCQPLMFQAPPFRKAGCQFDQCPIIAIAQKFMREQMNLG